MDRNGRNLIGEKMDNVKDNEMHHCDLPAELDTENRPPFK